MRGQDVERVGIIGPGTIDGNRTKRDGPKPIALKNCRHVAVRDLMIRNAPNYNIGNLNPILSTLCQARLSPLDKVGE